MAVLYSNNAETTITQSISASATTIQVATGDGAEFPNPGTGDHFYVTLAQDLVMTRHQMYIFRGKQELRIR